MSYPIHVIDIPSSYNLPTMHMVYAYTYVLILLAFVGLTGVSWLYLISGRYWPTDDVACWPCRADTWIVVKAINLDRR